MEVNLMAFLLALLLAYVSGESIHGDLEVWNNTGLFMEPNGINDTFRDHDYDIYYDSKDDEEISSLPFRFCQQCACGVPNRSERIVGGEETRKNEFPWLVALTKNGTFYCAGSLITQKHILTAAHCLKGFDVRHIVVTLAQHDRSRKSEKNVIKRRIRRGAFHSGFSYSHFDNDIALLELESPVEFGPNIRPGCLPIDDKKNHTGKLGVVAGWGRTGERESTSSVTRKVNVPVISRNDCLKAGYNPAKITQNMICAGHAKGKKDACQGDSGGPLHIIGANSALEIIGIVSWGRGCARPNFPGVYTRTSRYLTWMSSHLKGECICPPPPS